MSDAQPIFVISLDMELMWGVRDHKTKESYGHRVLGERQAIPAMLDLFERNGVHATWAVVGMVLCDGRDELLARAPEERPTYLRQHYSNYAYLDETGGSEREDPYYFAPSLMRRVLSCPGQELSTHTFSHYYCLEDGQTPDQFRADIRAAADQLRDWGSSCRSIVFPRNQYSPAHLEICRQEGIGVFRGNEKPWLYRSSSGDEQTKLRRAGRILDAYAPLTGANVAKVKREGSVINIPSSRFLRPYNGRLRHLDRLRLRRITSAMTAAAREGGIFHLWWHPHNFGGDTPENLAFLGRILSHFRRLRDEHGMRAATMAEAAA